MQSTVSICDLSCLKDGSLRAALQDFFAFSGLLVLLILPEWYNRVVDVSATTGRKSGIFPEISARVWPHGGPRTGKVWTWVLVCLMVLALATVALGRAVPDDEGLDQLDRHGPGPIQRIMETWQQWGGVCTWIAAVLLLIVALWIIKPFRIYDSISERLLKRSLRSVDELLKRIQEEAEATSENAPKDEAPPEEGLLAGLAEVAEFSNAEQVPSYVLTVNDLMLDNIRLTLKRLRRFTDSSAQRYRDYMFSVLKGIKTLTEQSVEAGIGSGLAVDIREYFADDKRYQAWRRLLSGAANRGKHQELAQSFLLFMRDVKEGRPLVPPKSAAVSLPELAVSATDQAPEIPKVVSEETLPVIQKVAAEEARSFCSLIQTGGSADGRHAWQFEFVRRQQQVHLKPEAQRMFAIFLSHERKTLREITKIRMLPCRTWDHILHLLGVRSGEQLQKRVEGRLLTIQEIVALEKAFLQTFAKRESLGHVYGRDKDAGLMMDLHVPVIRRETLSLLRTLHQAEPEHLDDATQMLNDEETPQNGQVKRLIEHYIHHRHDPPR
jgi:hypothetical protein